MSIIAAAIPLIGNVLDRVLPNKAARDKAKAELDQMQERGELQALEAAAGIITAEAKGESALQRNWRPITMLVFVYIIAHNYIVSPVLGMFVSVPMLEIPPDMWDLLKLGIGGYIMSRGGEKMIKNWRKP